MKNLTELEKLKYWVDTEFTITHVFLAVIVLLLTEGWVWNIIIGAYILYCLLYILTRLATIAADDPNYLRVPKNRK